MGTQCLAATGAEAPGDNRYDAELDASVELYGDRKYAEAAERLSTITKQFPERSEGFYWHGLALFQMKKWGEARNAFQRFCELDPDNVEGKMWMARVFLQARSYALAILWLQRALALDPENEEAKRLMALAKEAQKKAEETPAPPPVPAGDDSADNKRDQSIPTSRDSPGTGARSTDDTHAADDGSEDKASGNWWKGGFVGSLQASYRGWVTAGGIVLMILLWGMVAGVCVAIFEPPLLDEEVAKTVMVCVSFAVAFYVLWWGYGCWWGWLLLLFGIGQLSGGTIRGFKRS